MEGAKNMAQVKSTQTRSESASDDLNQDEQEQLAIIKASLQTIRHYFGRIETLFCEVDDPRVPHLITYPLEVLAFAGMLMFLCRLGARRQIALMFRGNGASAAKFQALFGVDNCPHGDTLDATFSRLNPDQVQLVVTAMIRTLIRKKVLDRYRLLGWHFVIAMDGTGRLSFPERHCAHCLTRTQHGKTIYYHPVLEAKLVLANGFAFSIMTEFVENPDQQPTKQDCELTAFYRLAKRLKQAFPRLPICLSLDGLFAGGPTMTICEQYHWPYIIALQEDDLPTVNQEFKSLLPLAPENHLSLRTGPQNKTHQDYRWINDISYQDTKRNEHTLAVLECLESKPDSAGQRQTTRFKWITNLAIKAKQVTALANLGGRIRWKIENEGFNVQKNGGFALEHAYTRDHTASKVFYLLLQIAHLIAQLIEKGSLFRKAFPAGVGSAKNIAFRFLEAWRNLRLNVHQIQTILDARFQIRFAPP
jgi:hypothetical protein